MRKITIVGLAMLLVSGLGINTFARMNATPKSTVPQSSTWMLDFRQKVQNPAPLDFIQFQASGQTISFVKDQILGVSLPDNFFNNSKVTLKNSSGKTINSVRIMIFFYTDAINPSVKSVDVLFGSNTAHPKVSPDKWITHAETVEIDIPSSSSGILTDAITTARGANPTFQGKIKFVLDQVMFDGEPNRKWRQGFIMERDPDKPTRFHRIDVPRQQESSSGTKIKSSNFSALSQRDRNNVTQAKMSLPLIENSWDFPTKNTSLNSVFNSRGSFELNSFKYKNSLAQHYPCSWTLRDDDFNECSEGCICGIWYDLFTFVGDNSGDSYPNFGGEWCSCQVGGGLCELRSDLVDIREPCLVVE